MALTEAQKRAEKKYRKSEKGIYATSKATSLSFFRNKATETDLKNAITEINKILIKKEW